MPTLKDHKANHQAFFAALAKLAYDHAASIEGNVVTFTDGHLDPKNCKPGFENEATARYLLHSVGRDEPVRVEALEYNWNASQENPCGHPWHNNPGLITPCPECDAGTDPTLNACVDCATDGYRSKATHGELCASCHETAQLNESDHGCA